MRHVYYEENDLDRIVTYCEKDTIAVAQLLLKLQNKPLLETDEIFAPLKLVVSFYCLNRFQ